MELQVVADYRMYITFGENTQKLSEYMLIYVNAVSKIIHKVYLLNKGIEYPVPDEAVVELQVVADYKRYTTFGRDEQRLTEYIKICIHAVSYTIHVSLNAASYTIHCVSLNAASYKIRHLHQLS